jgi:GNAT superfamily N-acetyltransferase
VDDLHEQMTIRVATESDIRDIQRVRMSVNENRIASLSVLPEGKSERLVHEGCGWVCEIDERVVAFAIADLSHANVYALFVEPGYERRGIGRQLHDTMMEWFFAAGLEQVWLSTDPNTRAEQVYRKAGRVPTGNQPNGEIRFEMSHGRWSALRVP